MDKDKLQAIAQGLDRLDKSEWNTLKNFIDVEFEQKAVEANISLSSSEIVDALKNWSDS